MPIPVTVPSKVCVCVCACVRPLGCWDCGFEFPRGHGCLSLVNVACCRVEVSATGRAVDHRRPTECGVSECDHETSLMRRSKLK
jgi:hypothetical protein